MTLSSSFARALPALSVLSSFMVRAGEVEAADANEKLIESLTEDGGTRIAAACLHQDSSGWLQRQLPPDLRAPDSQDGSPGQQTT